MAQTKWDKLISKWYDGDVPSQIDELQRVCKRWEPVCIVILGAGLGLMCLSAMISNHWVIAWGLFLAITGMVGMALIKIWVHIKLSTLRLIRELQEQKTSHSG